MKKFHIIINVFLFILAITATVIAGWLFFIYFNLDCGGAPYPLNAPVPQNFWYCNRYQYRNLAEISGFFALIFWVVFIWHLRLCKKYSKL